MFYLKDNKNGKENIIFRNSDLNIVMNKYYEIIEKELLNDNLIQNYYIENSENNEIYDINKLFSKKNYDDLFLRKIEKKKMLLRKEFNKKISNKTNNYNDSVLINDNDLPKNMNLLPIKMTVNFLKILNLDLQQFNYSKQGKIKELVTLGITLDDFLDNRFNEYTLDDYIYNQNYIKYMKSFNRNVIVKSSQSYLKHFDIDSKTLLENALRKNLKKIDLYFFKPDMSFEWIGILLKDITEDKIKNKRSIENIYEPINYEQSYILEKKLNNILNDESSNLSKIFTQNLIVELNLTIPNNSKQITVNNKIIDKIGVNNFKDNFKNEFVLLKKILISLMTKKDFNIETLKVKINNIENKNDKKYSIVEIKKLSNLVLDFINSFEKQTELEKKLNEPKEKKLEEYEIIDDQISYKIYNQ